VQQEHPASGYSILDAEHDRGLRHLGVPFAASLADRVSAAFAAQPHSMRAAGSKWAAAAPNLLGRVLVSAQCLASKAVYQANFHSPTPELLSQMQQAVNSFVASPMRREEVSPNPSCLYPCARIFFFFFFFYIGRSPERKTTETGRPERRKKRTKQQSGRSRGPRDNTRPKGPRKPCQAQPQG
jgi:hypothetical protein